MTVSIKRIFALLCFAALCSALLCSALHGLLVIDLFFSLQILSRQIINMHQFASVQIEQ
jgi:hypothetical protein